MHEAICAITTEHTTRMGPMNPVSGWQRLQDVYYTLDTCYDELSWPIEADIVLNYRTAVSTSAIALALKFVAYPNLIEVYGFNGKPLCQVVYNSTPSDHIVDFLFHGDHLVVVLSSGKVRYYSDFSGHFNEYQIDQDAHILDSSSPAANGTGEESGHYITDLETNQREAILGVKSAHVWSDWLVVEAVAGFYVLDLNSFARYLVPVFGRDFPEGLKVHAVAGFDNTIYVAVDSSMVAITIDVEIAMSYTYTDHQLTDGPFNYVSICPNGKLVALLNATSSTIYVVNNVFSKILLQYEAKSEYMTAMQMEWVGNDAIALSLRDEVRVIGPSQQLLSFFYDTLDDEFDLDNMFAGSGDQGQTYVPVVPLLITTSDGVIVVSHKQVQFLCRVSQSQLDLFQVGSSHPSSILFDCVDKMHTHASRADINISLLKQEDGMLVQAIDTCLEAALQVFDIELQKKLLKAASFGKIYCESLEYNLDNYLNTVNTLKVLNQLRASEIGLMVTAAQISSSPIGWRSVIEQLLRRNHYMVALEVTDTLPTLHQFKLTVYLWWCSAKIRASSGASDAELFNIIKAKLESAQKPGKEPARNYLLVGSLVGTAHEEGRNDLCTQLIGLEPIIGERIAAYLRFDEVEMALLAAIETGHPDLAVCVLLHLQKTLSPAQFYKVLNQTELSVTNSTPGVIIPRVTGELLGNFWLHSIGKYDPQRLATYYNQHDNTLAINETELAEATTADEAAAALTKLAHGPKENRPIYQRQLDLLDCKRHLCEMYSTQKFLENPHDSLVDTLVKLVEMHQVKQGAKIVKQFKISQEKWWWIVLNTYVAGKNFERLHQFALQGGSSDRSPIGWKPFIDAGFAHGAPPTHISDYIRKSALGAGDKFEMFLRNRDIALAADVAFKMKDVARLRQMKELYNLDEHQQLLDLYLQKLNA